MQVDTVEGGSPRVAARSAGREPVFHSVLFDRSPPSAEADEEPACFADLNLDQVVEAATSGREEYDLAPFFWMPLSTVTGVEYRQTVFRDLDATPLLDVVRSFAGGMQSVREYLAQADKLRHPYQQKRWFLDAAGLYGEVVRRFTEELAHANVQSGGLRDLCDHLARYVDSEEFQSLMADVAEVRQAIDRVHYCVYMRGNRVHVSRFNEEPDYSVEVERSFAKFKQGGVKDYRTTFRDWPDMNHVEGQILDLVAQLFSRTFARLDAFCDRHRNFLDQTIARFDREVQFYVGYLEYLEDFKAEGLAFCYPEVSKRSKRVSASDTFDLALATRLVGDGKDVVTNDLDLHRRERIVVVTGPNQGGKTTLARTVGQLHYLAALGCPVPGTSAHLFLCDQVFTHFEREEELVNLRSKLEDDLVRVHAIFEQATANSVLIFNEIFTSTTLDDALFLGRRILDRVVALDALCVYVTFADELSTIGETIVSMVSTVEPDDPAMRTYKVVRRRADGLAYAAALADKHRLTYEQLRRRISP
jgi:DNA mismatch repair protein MutS